MTANIGTVDRLIRGLLGLALLLLPFLTGWAAFDTTWVKGLSALAGVVMLATAGMRVCPLYSILGIRTCRM